MKHLFIINPVAGGKDHSSYVAAEAARAFAGRSDTYELYVTRAPMDASEKVKAASACDELLRVYACGGDGTLNECVCGAAGLHHVAVTHFPCGTGNDFVKMFGEDKVLFKDLSRLVDGEVRPLDVIRCNDRYSVNICSVGVDARIGSEVHKYSHVPLIGGATGYVASTAVNFIKGINRPMRIRIGSRSFSGELALACACNGRYYGGGFNPVPDARPDDGLLDFLVVKGVSRAAFLKLIGGYAKGRYRNMPRYITHLRGTEMQIDADEDFVVNLDGEIIVCRELSLRLLPGGINFLLPRNMAFFLTDIKN